jgi:hypothetical protein
MFRQSGQNINLIDVSSHVLLKVPALLFSLVVRIRNFPFGPARHVAGIVRSQVVIIQAPIGLAAIAQLLRGLDEQPTVVFTTNIGNQLPNLKSIGKVGR